VPRESHPNDKLKLATPRLRLSTKIGFGVLAAVLVFCVVSFWLPSPAGWIAAVLLIYVGLSLALLVVSDLGVLRQQRLLAKHSALAEPTSEDPDSRVMLDARGLTCHQLARWRAWRRWFAVVVAVAIVLALLASEMALRIVAASLVILGSLRDLQLGIRVLQSLPRSMWSELSRLEKAWLRIEAGVVGLVFLSIWLGVVAIIAYLFSGHVPVRWNTFAFTLMSGLLGLAMLVGGKRWVAMAFAAVPGHDTDSLEVVRVVRDVEEDDGIDD